MKRLLKMIAKRVLLPLGLVVLGAGLAGYFGVNYLKSGNDNANWYDPQTGIDEAGMVAIGGLPQFIRIRGQDLANPVLLDLHGGPGAAQSAFTYRMLKPWTEFFTVVEWDQRGAGKSAGSDGELQGTMTFEHLVDDTIEVIEHLQTRLGVHKVILVGHSWGSILGLTVASRRPDLLHAYVGMGQAVAWRAGFDESARLLMEAAQAAGDHETLAALQALPREWPPAEDSEGFNARLQVIQGPLARYGKSVHALKNTADMLSSLGPEMVLSPDTPLVDLDAIFGGGDATQRLVQDIYDLDLRRDLGNAFDVPLFFFQGEHDWQTPTTLARPFAASLTAPIKEYIPFEKSAHILINEEPGKILVELVNRVRPLAL